MLLTLSIPLSLSSQVQGQRGPDCGIFMLLNCECVLQESGPPATKCFSVPEARSRFAKILLEEVERIDTENTCKIEKPGTCAVAPTLRVRAVTEKIGTAIADGAFEKDEGSYGDDDSSFSAGEETPGREFTKVRKSAGSSSRKPRRGDKKYAAKAEEAASLLCPRPSHSAVSERDWDILAKMCPAIGHFVNEVIEAAVKVPCKKINSTLPR